jgi:hypothetical protein
MSAIDRYSVSVMSRESLLQAKPASHARRSNSFWPENMKDHPLGEALAFSQGVARRNRSTISGTGAAGRDAAVIKASKPSALIFTICLGLDRFHH